MNIQNLTQKFIKKNIPDVAPGDTVRISYKINEGNKTRIQPFEGLIIAMKHGKGLDGTIKVRKISDGVGVERTFPLHSPLIVKFEKIKAGQSRKSKLYYVRDISDKQRRRRATETKDYAMWEESVSEEELAKIEAEKVEQAQQKQAAKEAKEKELEEKFEQAVASHMEEKETETEEK